MQGMPKPEVQSLDCSTQLTLNYHAYSTHVNMHELKERLKALLMAYPKRLLTKFLVMGSIGVCLKLSLSALPVL